MPSVRPSHEKNAPRTGLWFLAFLALTGALTFAEIRSEAAKLSEIAGTAQPSPEVASNAPRLLHTLD